MYIMSLEIYQHAFLVGLLYNFSSADVMIHLSACKQWETVSIHYSAPHNMKIYFLPISEFVVGVLKGRYK